MLMLSVMLTHHAQSAHVVLPERAVAYCRRRLLPLPPPPRTTTNMDENAEGDEPELVYDTCCSFCEQEDLLDAAALLKAAKAGMAARYLFDANKITYDRIKADKFPRDEPHSLNIPKVVIMKVNYRQGGREEGIPKVVVKNVKYKVVGWDGKDSQ